MAVVIKRQRKPSGYLRIGAEGREGTGRLMEMEQQGGVRTRRYDVTDLMAREGDGEISAPVAPQYEVGRVEGSLNNPRVPDRLSQYMKPGEWAVEVPDRAPAATGRPAGPGGASARAAELMGAPAAGGGQAAAPAQPDAPAAKPAAAAHTATGMPVDPEREERMRRWGWVNESGQTKSSREGRRQYLMEEDRRAADRASNERVASSRMDQINTLMRDVDGDGVLDEVSFKRDPKTGEIIELTRKTRSGTQFAPGGGSFSDKEGNVKPSPVDRPPVTFSPSGQDYATGEGQVQPAPGAAAKAQAEADAKRAEDERRAQGLQDGQRVTLDDGTPAYWNGQGFVNAQTGQPVYVPPDKMDALMAMIMGGGAAAPAAGGRQAPAAGGGGGDGAVVMQFPDGSRKRIPAGRVAEMEKAGGRRL